MVRYSKEAAALLSTVITFRVKSLVVADIFDSSNEELHPGTEDTALNGLLTASSPTSATTITINHERKPVDTGILNPVDTGTKGTDVIASSSGITITSTCDTFVTCKNGLDSSDPTDNTKCFDTCNNNCCTFDDGSGNLDDACSGFTGKVCMDGKSCNGKYACWNAYIPSVVNSCIGDEACYKAGGDGGSVGNVNDLCTYGSD